MTFNLKGNLAGEICGDCKQPLSSVKIYLFRAARTNDNLTHAVADTKENQKILDAKTFAGIGKPLATATTDARGDYSFRFDGDKQDYNGEPLHIVLEITHLPPMEGPEKKHETVYVYLGTHEIGWEENQSGKFARLDLCLVSRLWCAILELFDVWVICGRVMDCDDKKPLRKVEVTAMDADCITDDKLGTTFTDDQGYFRIYYRSADFKKTFLSPVINVETPFSSDKGPDVYFIVKTSAGEVILEETRQDGKKEGRANVKNCFCITLCIDIADDDQPSPYAMTWNGIGQHFLIPDSSSLNDFNAAGYAGTAPYAFYRTIRLTGQGPNPVAPGLRVEYRFLVSDTAGVNGAAPLPAANFTKVVGVSPGLFQRTLIGTMVRYVPSVKYVRVYCEQADLDANGWFDPRRAVQRTFATDPEGKGITPADLTDPAQDWSWDDGDALMALDTRALTNEEGHATPGVSAGEVVPPANRIPIEKSAIRFEIRAEVSSGVYLPMPGNGVTLNAMVMNNDPMFARLALKDSSGNIVTCQKFTREKVFLAYTGYHPHLGSLNLNVRSNDGAYNHNQSDGQIPFPGAHPVTDHANNPMLEVSPAVNVTCTYTCRLSYQLRLHTGDGAINGSHIQTSFYYEA